jgi:hypothetical protein
MNLTKKLVFSFVLALMLCCAVAIASAGAAGIPNRDGTIHACVVTKGKKRGSVRLVRSTKACKKRRGERPLSWSAQGFAAAGGQAVAGPEGRSGPQGERGVVGPVGQVEQALLDTIAAQKAQIDLLTGQVETLGDELGALKGTVDGLGTTVSGLETTVADACAQLSTVTTQVDDVGAAVTGLKLNNVLLLLNGALLIAGVPDPLGSFTCK